MVLQGCFTDDIIVENHAKNGRSSISFINEGLWQKVLERIKPGDYVFIQFGHNDEKHDQPGKAKRFAKPGSSFDDNLTGEGWYTCPLQQCREASVLRRT